jgi:two-component system sensor histidine kinase/response regulator
MGQASDHRTRCRGHILLAEDDLVVQMVTTRVLEQAAYSVQVVSNGLEVIKALKLADFDLVLMDGSMPGMDGFETTRIIRSTHSAVRQPGIPIIALTALDTDRDRENCIRVGMDDYVSKPVNPDLLIAAIERCLEKSADDKSTFHQHDKPDKPVWSEGFLDTIIDKFLDELPQVITDLNTAIGKADVSGLKDIGHRLRGPADLLGATNLSARSCDLEQAAISDDMSQACLRASELIEELQLLMNATTDD